MAEIQETSYDKLYIPRDGVWFDPEEPDPGKMDEESIAHGLATEFRYGGHTEPLVTVAQHAVDTATLLGEMGYGAEVQLYGLHHDSAEAYLGDSQKPNKEAVPPLDEFEDVWQQSVWDFLDLGAPSQEQYQAVKDADHQLYLYEVENLFENPQHADAAGGVVDIQDWSEIEEVTTDIDEIVNLDTTVEGSKQEFLDAHHRLVDQN
jgi:5'-deoxynucleotidase YfbR-like HD superfamily hydrolase